MVPAGSIVRCEVTATTQSFGSPDFAVQNVSSLLAQSGFGVVGASTTTPGMLDDLTGSVLGNGVQFQAVLDVQVPSAFGDPKDVLSIVENAFYQVTGAYPTAASAPSVTSPGGSAQSTGEPGLSSSGIGGSGSGVTGAIASGLSNAGSSLLGVGSHLLIGVIVLIVAILFIVGYSPNTRAVAGALR
jgi:hypothetical protein